MLTKKERELLVEVLDILKSDGATFICYALEHASRRLLYKEGIYCDEEVRRLHKFVMKQISPCATLREWQLIHDVAHIDGRSARIQWIEWMLAEE